MACSDRSDGFGQLIRFVREGEREVQNDFQALC